MSSSENLETEANKCDSKIEKHSLKRLSKHNLPDFQGKRSKFNEQTTSQRLCDIEINESGVDILQDTLDSLDVTKLLEKNENELKLKLNSEKSEFDAFADYLSKGELAKPGTNRQLFDVEDESISSQFFNTQVVNQIDNMCKLVDTNVEVPKEKCGKTTENIAHNFGKNEDFKTPLLQNLKEKLKSAKLNEISLKNEISDRSGLFEDEKVTSQYREEVDNLFEQIEHSIFAMGTEQKTKIPDKLLDIIFSDDLQKTSNKESSERNGDNINWPENTLLNELSFNASFGSIIKKALINNASKSAHTEIPRSTLNLTISDKKLQFYSLGPFYGLPLKVKDLIKQYKGIEELYGKYDISQRYFFNCSNIYDS